MEAIVHPSLNFECPATQDHISLGFGYLAGEPMMPIFKGDELVAMLPRKVLILALEQGWGGTEMTTVEGKQPQGRPKGLKHTEESKAKMSVKRQARTQPRSATSGQFVKES